MIIYKVTNKQNNKVYIGQTKNTLEYRKSQHERDCKYHRNSYFHEALLKYGFESFEWEVIDQANTQEEIDILEKKYIKECLSTNKEYGYNLKHGGKEGGLYNEECRRRLGESTKKKWSNPETSAKMLAGLRKGTETQKEKGKHFFEIRICPCCGNAFKVKPHMKNRFCSVECSNKSCKELFCENLKKATQKNIEEVSKIRNERQNLIKEWAKQNKSLILGTPKNKVSTTLNGLFEYVGVKDMRTIAACVGCKYKKDFLDWLKEYVTNNN